MANCLIKSLTSEIIDHMMQESEPYRFTLTQMHALYAMQMTTMEEEVCYCLERVVTCSVECGDTEFVVPFPEGCCLTILPAGTYQITIAEQYIHTVESGELGIDFVLEPVDTPFVQSIQANGCT